MGLTLIIIILISTCALAKIRELVLLLVYVERRLIIKFITHFVHIKEQQQQVDKGEGETSVEQLQVEEMTNSKEHSENLIYWTPLILK